MEGKLLLRLAPDEINASPEYNSRTFAPSQERIDSLILSFLDVGQLQPVTIRLAPYGDADRRPHLVFGATRHAAAQQITSMQGEPFHLECELVSLDDRAAFLASLRENIDRNDLSPMDRAYAMDRLIVEFGMTQRQVAEVFQVSPATVNQALKLLKLPLGERQRVHEGTLSVEAAFVTGVSLGEKSHRALAKEDEDEQDTTSIPAPSTSQPTPEVCLDSKQDVEKTGVSVENHPTPVEKKMRSSKDIRLDLVKYFGGEYRRGTGTSVFDEGWEGEDLKNVRAYGDAMVKYVEGRVGFYHMIRAFNACVPGLAYGGEGEEEG